MIPPATSAIPRSRSHGPGAPVSGRPPLSGPTAEPCVKVRRNRRSSCRRIDSFDDSGRKGHGDVDRRAGARWHGHVGHQPMRAGPRRRTPVDLVPAGRDRQVTRVEQGVQRGAEHVDGQGRRVAGLVSHIERGAAGVARHPVEVRVEQWRRQARAHVAPSTLSPISVSAAAGDAAPMTSTVSATTCQPGACHDTAPIRVDFLRRSRPAPRNIAAA